ncbi:MAG: DUF362 domain-containing protein [candidate division Zixibacteria bacterium]|nr:DUF362 domain-containing protein [candidate division Zixibacteria bacterium]
MSKVVVIRLAEKPDVSGLSEEQYRTLLYHGLSALSDGKPSRQVLSDLMPRGVVGMKTNCLTGRFNSTPTVLIDALTHLLIEAGIKENNIVIWERSNRELTKAGFALNASSFGRRCLGTDTNGVGYSREFYSCGEVNSLVSKVLTDLVDHNINVPILKDHSIAGLSGGIKNMFGAIHNPNKYHLTNCDPYAAQVINLEPLRTKQRLTVMDAVRVQYHGGPGFNPKHVVMYGGIVISADPVAADSIGLKIIEQYRAQNDLPALWQDHRPVKYLQTAAKLGLGIADESRIDLRTIHVDSNGSSKPGELFP